MAARLDGYLMIRLTKPQKRAFTRAAAATGLSLSAWLRQLGLRELRKHPRNG
jgi:predicted HicB family RNase H-like nuclease